MKKFKTLGLLFSILLSSCSYHIGTIGGGTGTITNNQFKSIDFGYGTAKTTKFLGIGGNEKDGLVLEAKRNLYRNYKLRPAQVIGQTTVDFKRTFFFPISTTKVTISAEIIDFSDSVMDSAQIQQNKEQFEGQENTGEFALGEVVIFQENEKKYVHTATILSFKDGKYTIRYVSRRNIIKIKTVHPVLLKAQTKKVTL
ncbi:MAG: DUF6567 family protein [Cytophagales bacterium]|nr:DUF6567 family protein [Cytophagales bacterium]